MKEEEITALAREYAEEIRKDILPFFPQPLPNSMEVLVQKDQKEAEQLIRFLLSRYRLVEKSAYALGKQEKDAEETTIQGWVARNRYNEPYLYTEKPHRINCGIVFWRTY